MSETCDKIISQSDLILFILVFLWEYFLGKTKIIKPNSTLAIAAHVTAWLWRRFITKGKDNA